MAKKIGVVSEGTPIMELAKPLFTGQVTDGTEVKTVENVQLSDVSRETIGVDGVNYGVDPMYFGVAPMEQIQPDITIEQAMEDESYVDEIGGVHDCGLGWAPDGTYCGECSYATCVGCSVAEKHMPTKVVAPDVVLHSPSPEVIDRPLTADDVVLEIFRNRSVMEAQIIFKATGEIIDRIPVQWRARDNKLDYLSVSKIGAYEQCPACFHRQYISDDTTEEDGGNFFTKFGSILHEVSQKLVECYEATGIILDTNSVFDEVWKSYDLAGFDAYLECKGLAKWFFDIYPVNHRKDKAILIEHEWRGQLGGCTFGMQIDYAGQMLDNPENGILKDYKSNRMPFTNADLQSSLQLRIYEIILRRHLMPWIKNWRSGYELFRFGWQECPTRTEEDLKLAEDYVSNIWTQISQDNIWEEKINNYCCYRECRHECSSYQKFVKNPNNYFIKTEANSLEEIEKQRMLMTSYEKIIKQRKEELNGIMKAEIEQCTMRGEKLVIGGQQLQLYSNATGSYGYYDTRNVMLAHNKLDVLDRCLTVSKSQLDKAIAGDGSLKLALAGCIRQSYAAPYITKSKH